MAESNVGQEPLAIVGVACRLPGGATTPSKLWDFLEEGRIAPNTVPASRFRLSGHWDGSHKPGTMRPAGGMFLSEDDVDLTAFDASFFEIAGAEAVATDPNQRQMLEVVYEGLESAGIPMDAINGKPVAVFAASFAVDYADIHARNPEDKPGNTGLGVGRAILANRLSWFYNLKGPSVTVDTACSGSLIALDMATRTLRSGEVDMAIVAASNLYMSPEHVIDDALVGQAHSPTGLCHSFDAAADGYVKAEAVSCLILKRLASALRDGDPIRAVLRGVAINANGRTNGIGSPSSEAQAAAIRKAYANAGITNLNDTQFLECHGTGTKAGDAIEVAGVAQAFASSRETEKPLIIGSIKSNMGHAEPAAGLSGLIKAILSLEHAMIPATPLFINPNPKIDFAGAMVRACRTIIPWPSPEAGKPRRASVNSFGYGGANGHAILEEARFWSHTPNHVDSIRGVDELPMMLDDDVAEESTGQRALKYYTLVLSANDAASLHGNIEALCNHLVNPRVQVSLHDLAYTLSQRRTHHWHRAFVSVGATSHQIQTVAANLKVSDFTAGKKAGRPLRIGFVFTGQGAQWPQMGRALLQAFPLTVRQTLKEMDEALQGLKACQPPSWSLLDELTQPRSAEHVRQPEFSQPLVTALQICLLGVLAKWGVKPSSVVGHSSGEIAAAYAAGLLDKRSAIKAAFFRGYAVKVVSQREQQKGLNLGMLAVGTDVDTVTPFLKSYADGEVSIACFNSPTSLTISGPKQDLAVLEKEIKAAGHFARLLQVDMAYHSPWMNAVGDEYRSLMESEFLIQEAVSSHSVSLVNSSDRNSFSGNGPMAALFSSLTGDELGENTNLMARPVDIEYWRSNLLSPVLFDRAVEAMLSQPDKKSPDMLIEIGPSGALSGPITQILKTKNGTEDVSYFPAWSRGPDAAALKSLFDVAGRLFANGSAELDLAAVNKPESGGDAASETNQTETPPRCIVDLPGYRWNHSVKYWHESIASKDWRFRPFVTHDLIGSKVLGTPWTSPTWYKRLELQNLPWLRDHTMGGHVLLPGAGFCIMAIEALYQKHTALDDLLESAMGGDNATNALKRVSDLAYGLRNVRFEHAMVVEEAKPVHVYLTLSRLARSSSEAGWHEFCISSTRDGVSVNHCVGQIRVLQQPLATVSNALEGDRILAPLQTPESFALWYKTQREVGMEFGPSFRRIQLLEAMPGLRECRALVNLNAPSSKHSPQSHYALHPAVMDSCLQALMAPNAANERSLVKEIQIPGIANEVILYPVSASVRQGLVHARSRYSGRGRLDQAKGIVGDVSLYDAETGAMLMQLNGLGYARLDADRKPDGHVFDTVVWKPDVDLLTLTQLTSSTFDFIPPGPMFSDQHGTFGTRGKSKLDILLDLVAHKRPLLHVLEVRLQVADEQTSDGDSQRDISSLWLTSDTTPSKQGCKQYDLACPNSDVLVALQNKYKAVEVARTEHVRFLVTGTLDEPSLGLGDKYDLVIVQLGVGVDAEQRQELRGRLASLLVASGGFVLMVRGSRTPMVDLEEMLWTGSFIDGAASSSAPSSSYSAEEGQPRMHSDGISDSSVSTEPPGTPGKAAEVGIPYGPSPGGLLYFNNIHLSEHYGQRVTGSKRLTAVVAHLSRDVSEATSYGTSKLLQALAAKEKGTTDSAKQHQWNILSSKDMSNIQSHCKTADVIIVLDELFTSLLTNPSPEQWTAIQAIFSTGRPILWLTAGGASGANPERSMAHGLVRVVRREMASLDEKETPRVVLDFDDATDPMLVSNATTTVLDLIAKTSDAANTNIELKVTVEPEYRVTKDGIIEIARLVPDANINEFRHTHLNDQVGRASLAATKLWENKNVIQLRGERVGTLDLQWCEVASSPEDRELPDGYIQVEVHAVGVNFKDVAAVMGIIPEDEHMIGCESSGIITRLGNNLPASKQHLKIGDRVVVQGWGNYVNRIQFIAECVHGPIPDWMSYDEAATIPLAYATAVRSLFHLADLQPGQSVLIHSAAGGVGIAAIQLAKYRNASQIFVTVSTEEKREFLATEFGIPREHMWSSRDSVFAAQIMALTDNKGVDVVLNSLTGDLLDASWRIVADGGTMVEIGKRDILDRHALAMEPFGRNCSFRAVDLSFSKSHATARLLGELMRETFELISAGHVGPVRPINRYGFDQVPAALASMRKGQHIGKLVISRMGKKDVEVPVRPLRRTLQLRGHDASYLIVGGIKGLCGSLALHMARHGARHIIVCSRSGLKDEDGASKRVIRGCREAYDCIVTVQQGDVCDADFVQRIFLSAQESGRPIAGILQGAMVLRDGAFEAMQAQDYQVAVSAKVQGTWNLHNTSLDFPLLDFFTLLSSVSGVVGNKGQANYAAANAFLDAFASYRRSVLGLPAHSLDLGAVEEVGYIAAQQQQEQDDKSNLADRFFRQPSGRSEWTALDEEALRFAFTVSILQQQANPISTASPQLVTGLAHPLPTTSSLRQDARFGYLFSNASDGDGNFGARTSLGNHDTALENPALQSYLTLRDTITTSMTIPTKDTQSALEKAAVAALAAQTSRILRLDKDSTIEVGKPLAAYGLDSLSAVELRGWIRTRLGVEVTTLDITNARSLVELGEKVIGKLIPS
ncbi:polyketide synthase [Rhypophila decipiens]|uniref:Polyketide synthase n=1 Tax=Rhypophila decipiens TaxID=261697 RepID=A0AAN6Y8H5_9PEZI|nr:polyketide synthase [Rhypophila decipiens]